MKEHSPRFLALVEAARARIPELSAEALQARLAGEHPPRVLDVREAHEWAAGHIAGAEHLSKGVLERDIEAVAPDLDAELVLVCGGGYRSALAADALRQMGYRRAASLAGGWRAWQAIGGAVAQP